MGRIFFLIATVLVVLTQGRCKPTESIRDIYVLHQNHMSYIDIKTAEAELISTADQISLENDLRYFSPWHERETYPRLDNIMHEFEKYEKNPWFGENGLKRNDGWIKKISTNAALDTYPNAGATAITVDNADLRTLPMLKPHFNGPIHSYRGYLFDNFQESLIAVNTPIYIIHTTKDREWAFVKTPYACGWILSRNLAIVDDAFI